MSAPLETYLGWEKPQHNAGCRRTGWDIGIRTEERAYRYAGDGEPQAKHKCEDEFCTHGSFFTKTIVRLVCKACGAAYVIDGEKTEATGQTVTSTRYLGYGLPPLQKAGLLLWPARPQLGLGRAVSDDPHDFVVTRTGVKEVTADTAVGQIIQSRGKLGGLVWTALAVPDPEGRYGSQHIRWAHANDGHGQGGSPLRTVLAAARWIGARLAEQSGAGAA
ncbi:hypothetical protein [Streptomyces sp. NPDC048386]|uniref:hypothetical protein n=1 Tax=Streptomyces sp. NPDC048386 TaxID=3365541 RepID=UPI0037197BE7